MQHDAPNPGFTPITPTASMSAERHGARAKCLQRLIRLDLPVPHTVALDFDAVRAIAAGQMPDLDALLAEFPETTLLTVRPSSQSPDWGGPGAFLNVGMNDARRDELADRLGADTADAIYARFIEEYASEVERLDADLFEDLRRSDNAVSAMKAEFEAEAERDFPQDRAEQLSQILKTMA